MTSSFRDHSLHPVTGSKDKNGDAVIPAAAISSWVRTALEAETITGRVHSCFDRTINLVDNKGRLFCVAELGGGMIPFGILLAPEDMQRFASPLLQAGMKVQLDCDEIAIDGARKKIGIAKATSIDCRWGKADYDCPSVARLDALLSIVTAVAGERGHGFRIQSFADYETERNHGEEMDPFHRVLLGCLQKSLSALRCGEIERGAGELLGMIGLGRGLTPSGDDLLVGICAALIASRQRPETKALFEQLARGFCRFSSGRTTDIGYAYLIHAFQGRFAERVAVFRAAVLEGWQDVGTMDALRWLLGFGAASGGETALGVLTGFYLIGQTVLQATTVHEALGD